MKHFYTLSFSRHSVYGVKSLFAILLLFATGNICAQRTAVTSGNWSNPATWSPAGVPASTDSVVIPGGLNIVIDVNNATAKTVVLNNAAAPAPSNATLAFSATGKLTLNGLLRVFPGSGTGATLNMPGGGELVLRGFAQYPAIIAGPASAITLTADNTLNVPVGTTLNDLIINGGTTTITSPVTVTGDVTVATGKLMIDGDYLSRLGAGGSVSLLPYAELHLAGAAGLPANFSTYAFDSLSLVAFVGSNQSITGGNYGRLTMSGSGVKQAVAPINVATLITNNGTFNAGAFHHTVRGDWTNAGTFNAGTGTIELNGSTQQDIPALTFSKLYVSNTTGWVNALGDITVLDTLETTSINTLIEMGTNRLIMPDTAVVLNRGTIKTQNTSALPLPLNKAWGSSPYGTVWYNADGGGQTIVAGEYNNLNVSHDSGGTSTASGEIVIGGTVAAVTANTTINMGANRLVHTAAGGIGGLASLGTIRTQNTSLTPLSAGRNWGGTVVYDAPGGGQKIVFGTYNNLSVNTAGAENVASSIIVNGNFATSATTTINFNQDTITGAFNAIEHQGLLRTQAAVAFPQGKTWGGTVRFDASGDASASQTIVLGNYNNLEVPLIRGLGNNLIFQEGTYNVAGNLDISATVETTGAFVKTGSGFTFNLNGGNQAVSITAKHSPSNAMLELDGLTISGSDTKSLLTPVTMNGQLTLQNGVLKTTAANLLTLSNTATSLAPSLGTHNSYIDGPVRKKGTTAFTFPVGTAGIYAPLSIGAAGANGDYTAEYFRPQTLGTAVSTPIVAVSECEYWNLVKHSGANNPQVTLSYTAASNCGSGTYITSTANLFVGYWNGSSWVNTGNATVSGTADAGIVTSTADAFASPYGPLTIASDMSVTLPVVFNSINAMVVSEGIRVNWSVSTEIDVKHYELETSDDGTSFNKKTIVAAKNIQEGAAYSYVDNNPLANTVFYRVKAVDLDGKHSYSAVVKAYLTGALQNQLSIYPNPVANGVLSLAADFDPQDYTVHLYDATGKRVYKQVINITAATKSLQLKLPSYLTSGIYRVLVISKNQTLSSTLLIAR